MAKRKPITEKQFRFIYDLAYKLNLTKSQLYRLCGGEEPRSLDRKTASEVIEILLALLEKRKNS